MIKITSCVVLALGLMPLSASAAGGFDGIYVGQSRETINNNSGYCQGLTHDNSRIIVKDNTISYTWGKVPLETTIGGDGSFSVERPGMQATRGASGSYTLKGRISGGNLEADVGGTSCAAHLSLKKT
jgi:hypothetical protein